MHMKPKVQATQRSPRLPQAVDALPPSHAPVLEQQPIAQVWGEHWLEVWHEALSTRTDAVTTMRFIRGSLGCTAGDGFSMR
jgi:hypothetical protein